MRICIAIVLYPYAAYILQRCATFPTNQLTSSSSTEFWTDLNAIGNTRGHQTSITEAETPNEYINVFSKGTANTINFALQFVSKILGFTGHAVQDGLESFLSIANAGGQLLGGVVQNVPPMVLSSVRTALDVGAANAGLFGAVTEVGANVAKSFGTP